MRVQPIFLAFCPYLFVFILSCSSTRLGQIHPGMTKTDVAIELGRPGDVLYNGTENYWVYPASESKICKIQFDEDGKVMQGPLACDDSPPSQKVAAKMTELIPIMNSDLQYQERVVHYCGKPPQPSKQNCRILDKCTNGGWVEVCD